MTVSGANIYPVWTPDGKHIIFQSATPSGISIQWIRGDGGGAQSLLAGKDQTSWTPYSLSPDGRNLAFTSIGPDTAQDVWILPLDMSDPEHPRPGKPRQIVATPTADTAPAISPDGKWIAYSSLESGRQEIYVLPFPPPADGRVASKSQVSVDGGQHPSWSRTARELFFDTIDGHIMVAGYKTSGESFMAEKPRAWSSVQIVAGSPASWSFDLAPDGRHVMALVNPGATGEHSNSVRLNVLLNFFDEVRRRVPIK